MFKPIRWKTFPRDFLVIQIGFATFGFSLAMMIRANIGTSAWSMLEVAIAKLTGISIGNMSIIVGFAVLTGSVILREQIGWGTLGNILFIGPWIDLSLWLIPTIQYPLWLEITMLLAAIFLMGLASAVYIGVDAGAGPRDSLMLAIHRKTGWSVRTARTAIEVVVVGVGWLLGGPAGIGTVVFAVLIGPSVQFWFKALKVQTSREVDAEVEDG